MYVEKNWLNYFYTDLLLFELVLYWHHCQFRCFSFTDLSAVTRKNGFQIPLAVVYFILSQRCIFGSST